MINKFFFFLLLLLALGSACRVRIYGTTPRIIRNFRFCCIQTAGESDEMLIYHVIKTDRWRPGPQIRPAPHFCRVRFLGSICLWVYARLRGHRTRTPATGRAQDFSLGQDRSAKGQQRGWGIREGAATPSPTARGSGMSADCP